MSQILKLWKGLLHLAYPRLCAGCGSDIIGDHQFICLDCMENLPLTNFHLHDTNPVEKIFRGRLVLRSACSYVYFTKQSVMQQILHQLKYKGNTEAGIFFGRLIGKALRQAPVYDEADALIPLPLFYKKLRKRGYNQSKLICDGMAEIMNIPVLENVVKRNSATDTQTRMNREQRWKNMEGKFVLTDECAITGKYILLVDDVLTTGATLEACGAELLKAQNVKLGIVTLAYTSS